MGERRGGSSHPCKRSASLTQSFGSSKNEWMRSPGDSVGVLRVIASEISDRVAEDTELNARVPLNVSKMYPALPVNKRYAILDCTCSFSLLRRAGLTPGALTAGAWIPYSGRSTVGCTPHATSSYCGGRI